VESSQLARYGSQQVQKLSHDQDTNKLCIDWPGRSNLKKNYVEFSFLFILDGM
jgi:hypothetical protein